MSNFNWFLTVSLDLSFFHPLTINGIYGGREGGGDCTTTPPNHRKICEKTAKSIKVSFCKCYENPLGQLLKQFSKLYQLWGPVT